MTRPVIGLATLAALLGACGASNIIDTSPNPPTFTISRGPPCIMRMRSGDGTDRGSITHQTARCRVVIDGSDLP